MTVVLWSTLESLISVEGDRFPGRQEVYLLVISEIDCPVIPVKTRNAFMPLL